jgi:hypothetical protein
MSGQLIYVMGPSGAGKDSLLGFAREKVPGEPVVFAHRYITRPTGNGENHIALTPEEFEARSSMACLRSNGRVMRCATASASNSMRGSRAVVPSWSTARGRICVRR